MSEERLEEIVEEYEWHVENQLLPRTSDDNFEWLIERAKLSIELEQENEDLRFANENLLKEIQILKNYKIVDVDHPSSTFF